MGKIEWAPLNVPMRRRIETLSTALWMWLILFGELGMLISYFLLLVSRGGGDLSEVCNRVPNLAYGLHPLPTLPDLWQLVY